MRILEQLKGFVVWFWLTLFPSVRVRRWVNEVMLSAYHMSLQGQCCELVVLQLVWSAFSDVIQKKIKIVWLLEFTEWPGFPISPIFFSLDDTDVFRDDNERAVWGTLHVNFTTVQNFTPLGIFGMCWRRLCSSNQDLGKKWMPPWIEINVTLISLIKWCCLSMRHHQA